MNINERVQELEKQLEELKQEIAKQDKKEHKSLSDYKCYEKLKEGEEYKFISYRNDVGTYYWNSDNVDCALMNKGNMYSIDTPNELLEREIKKRQLWFALEKHLKENNCLATNEDFRNTDWLHTIEWDFRNERFYVISVNKSKYNTIYSTDEEVLKNYMNTLSEEDIKIMFDVE